MATSLFLIIWQLTTHLEMTALALKAAGQRARSPEPGEVPAATQQGPEGLQFETA